jgi:hypothetical protein
MTNVFIGGSRSIMKKLPGAVTKRIDNIIMLSRVQPKTRTPPIPSGFTACTAVSRFR